MGRDGRPDDAQEDRREAELSPHLPMHKASEEDEAGAVAEEMKTGDHGDGRFDIHEEHGNGGEHRGGAEPRHRPDHLRDERTRKTKDTGGVS